MLSFTVQYLERIRLFIGRATLSIAGAIVLIIAPTVAHVIMNPALAIRSMSMNPSLAWRGLVFGRDLGSLPLEGYCGTSSRAG